MYLKVIRAAIVFSQTCGLDEANEGQDSPFIGDLRSHTLASLSKEVEIPNRMNFIYRMNKT